MARRVLGPYPSPGFGEVLRQAREARGLKQRELAALLETTQVVIYGYEKEKHYPSEPRLKQLSEVLGIEVPQIVRNGGGRRTQGQRDCLTCGQTFEVYDRRQKYCSPDCWHARPHREVGQRAVHTLRNCVICGAEFHPVGSRKECCSRACSAEQTRRANPYQCERCGKPCRVHKKQPARFCSHACARAVIAPLTSRKTPLGTIKVNSDGYQIVKTPDGWILAHRFVMEKKLGRKLLPNERVHHLNGNRADNRAENLELWLGKTKNHPTGVRASDYHCPGCHCFRSAQDETRGLMFC